MTDLSDFQKECVRLALAKMFRPDGFFDICTVDKCLKICGAIPTRTDYEALSALHCLHFREMTPEMRRAVAERTLALFAAPGFDLPQLDKTFLPPRDPSSDEPRPALWQRVKGSLSS